MMSIISALLCVKAIFIDKEQYLILRDFYNIKGIEDSKLARETPSENVSLWNSSGVIYGILIANISIIIQQIVILIAQK